jgi:phosphate transport system substrate-binding protein
MLQRKTSAPFQTVLLLGLVSAPVGMPLLLTAASVEAQTETASPAFPLPDTLPTNAQVRIDGAESMSAINKALQDRFVQKYPPAKVTLEGRGTDAALAALEKGEIDLAAISRPLLPEETAKGLSQVPISREKIAIVVGADNPFNGNITFAQFAKIFRGEIADWSELGGTPGPIRFIDRPEKSDTRLAFRRYPVFQNAPFQTGTTAQPIAEDNTDAMVKALGKDGIGYATASQVLNREGIRILSMHKTLPDDPRYPFSQPRGYVYKGTPNAAVASFLGFATTPDGQAAVKTAEATTAISPGTAAAGNAKGGEATGGGAAPAMALDGNGLSWWPWLLGVPIAGGLLLWALKGRGKAATPIAPVAAGRGAAAAPTTPPQGGVVPFAGAVGAVAGATALGAGAAVAGAAGAARSARQSRMILTPRDHQSAYAYWEVPEEHKRELRQQGGQKMGVRLYDVTDISDPERLPAHSMQQFDCNELDSDRHLPIPRDNRDYCAEVGYDTQAGRWLPLARSNSVRVPARPLLDNVAKGAAAVVGGAAVVGLGAAARSAVTGDRPQSSRVILTPRDSSHAYVYWEAAEADKVNARTQGGQKLALRVYDVSSLSALAFQQYDVEEQTQDRHVPIPLPDHDYRAELGYVAENGRWIKVTQSASVRVPSAPSMSGAEDTMLRTGQEAADKTFTGLGNAVSGVGDAVAGAGSKVAGLGAAGLGAVAGLGAAAGLGQKVGFAATPSDATRIDAADPQEGCRIANLTVHSQRNCYVLDPKTMEQIQEKAVSQILEPGNYLIKIQSGAFGYHSGPETVGEPLILLWIYGGKVMNQKTKVEVGSTWSSLNGYDDLLTLRVLETTTLSAFFFDTEADDNQGEVTLSVVRV